MMSYVSLLYRDLTRTKKVRSCSIFKMKQCGLRFDSFPEHSLDTLDQPGAPVQLVVTAHGDPERPL
jgi:hypothetical protein